MKTKPAKKQNKKPGDFAHTQDMRFNLPPGFILLCKLWNITPHTVLTTFMEDLSCGSWKREGRDEAKQYLQQYAFAMGFGKQRYTPADRKQMFAGLDAIGMLWPEGRCTEKMLDLHIKWRSHYYRYWYKKWKNKYKPSKKPLKILD